MSDIVDALENVERAVERVEQAVKNKWSTAEWIGVGVIGCFLLWSLPGQIWHAKWRYALAYGVSTNKVDIANHPHGCSFFASPLGEKYCHYERTVSTVRWARSAGISGGPVRGPIPQPPSGMIVSQPPSGTVPIPQGAQIGDPSSPAASTPPPWEEAAQQIQEEPQILMVGPDGSTAYVSRDKVPDNEANGAEPAVRMTGPDGSKAIIRFSKQDINQKSGATWDVHPDNDAVKQFMLQRQKVAALGGSPIVSYDEGKTWEKFTPEPDDQVPSHPTVEKVHITWVKVDD